MTAGGSQANMASMGSYPNQADFMNNGMNGGSRHGSRVHSNSNSRMNRHFGNQTLQANCMPGGHMALASIENNMTLNSTDCNMNESNNG